MPSKEEENLELLIVVQFVFLDNCYIISLFYVAKHSSDGWKFTDVQLNKIAMHEIGHAIGILGHSDNINDIMYYSTASQRQSTLSSKDVDTVKKIYNF